MATERFTRVCSAAAIISSLVWVPVAKAEEGDSDRQSMRQESTERKVTSGQVDNELAASQPDSSVPLPPRRPKQLGISVAADTSGEPPKAQVAAVPLIEEPSAPIPKQPSEAAGQVSTANAEPVPANQQSVKPVLFQPIGPSNGIFVLSARSSPAFWGYNPSASTSGTPVKTEDVANNNDSPQSDLAVAELPPSIGKSVRAPFPPERPSFISDAAMALRGPLDDNRSALSVASSAPNEKLPSQVINLPSVPQPQSQDKPIASETPPASSNATLIAVPLPPRRPEVLGEPAAGVEKDLRSADLSMEGHYSNIASNGNEASPGLVSRLFSTPQEQVEEVVFDKTPPIRTKSKLNHIIGDDPVRASQLKALISKHAAANGIPFKFADAVIRVESRYNPRARNGPYVGLMQIHPRTAQGLGYQGGVDGLFDPDTNLQYGIKYLAMAYRLASGDTCGTIMRYQGGHRAVSMSSAARQYCSKVKMIFAENLP